MPKRTQTLSARVEDPSRLSAPAEPSRLAIAYLNTWRDLHPPPSPDQLTLLLLIILMLNQNYNLSWKILIQKGFYYSGLKILLTEDTNFHLYLKRRLQLLVPFET